MRPVLSHKGKQAVELVIEGRAGHSSNPALGENALYPAAELLLFVRDLAARLAAEGPFDERFSPPHTTLQAGVIRGGNAVNIIPDRASIEIEVRSVPGLAPAAVTAEVVAELAALADRAMAAGRHLQISHRELASYPALPPPEEQTLSGPHGAAHRPGRAAIGQLWHRGRSLPRGGHSRDRLRPRSDRAGAPGERVHPEVRARGLSRHAARPGRRALGDVERR